MAIDLDRVRTSDMRVTVGAVFLLLTASCSGGEDGQLADSRWLVMTVNEFPTVPGARPLIIFGADGAVEGNGGCNDFLGTYQTSSDRLHIVSFGSTLSSCGDSEARALEETLVNVLRSDPFFELSDGILHLTSPDGTTVVLHADPDTSFG